MDDLYREVIIEHYKNPGYRGHLDPHDIQFEDNNPLCGDQIEITLRTDESGTVTDARFDGHGCAISQASADLLVESIIGKPLEEVKRLSADFTAMMRGEETIDPESLGDLEALSGVRKFPVRVKCATLAWHTLEEALEEAGL